MIKEQRSSPVWDSWRDLADYHDGKLITIMDPAGQRKQAQFICDYTQILEKHKHYPISCTHYSMIEIGPGNGVMIEKLLEQVPPDKIKRVVLVDGPPMLEKCQERLSKWVRKHIVEYKIPEDIKTIEGNFNLLISCSCLPECTLDYQELIYNTFFPRTDEIFLYQTESATLGDRNPHHGILMKYIKKYYSTFKVFLPPNRVPTMREHEKIIWAKK